MTPQEKALELVDKFLIETENRTYCGLYRTVAIKCALIAVDELIEEAYLTDAYIKSVFFTDGYYDKQEYWIEVKREINKL